jgi:hypothetical protein
MLIQEMGRQECEDLLGRVGFGCLACTRDNQPYIVPVYFASIPGLLYGFATMGQKIEWMRLNAQVCVEADEVRSHTDWSTVLIRGHYEEFPDTAQYAQQRQQAQALLEKTTSLWWQVGIAAGQTSTI